MPVIKDGKPAQPKSPPPPPVKIFQNVTNIGMLRKQGLDKLVANIEQAQKNHANVQEKLFNDPTRNNVDKILNSIKNALGQNTKIFKLLDKPLTEYKTKAEEYRVKISTQLQVKNTTDAMLLNSVVPIVTSPKIAIELSAVDADIARACLTLPVLKHTLKLSDNQRSIVRKHAEKHILGESYGDYTANATNLVNLEGVANSMLTEYGELCDTARAIEDQVVSDADIAVMNEKTSG